MPVKGVSKGESGNGSPSAGRCDPGNPDAAAIRSELERILTSASFRNSKRHSALLKYLIDQTLDGNSNHLKERTIGVEVFDRPPDYDSNTDHVVRSSASEIRKRLAQYYQEPGSDSGIRIDLYPGGYVPSFRVQPPPAFEQVVVATESTQAKPVQARRGWLLHCVTAACAVIATLIVSAISSWHATTALDRFWRPITSQPGSVVICVGRHLGRGSTSGEEASAAGSAAGLDLVRDGGYSDPVVGGNAVTLARLAAQLQMRGKPFRVFLGASASFEDIQERAAVLVGAANNEWAIQVLKGLRFSIDGPGSPIVDTEKNPPQNVWMSNSTTRGYGQFYALVARYTSTETGKIIVVAGGTHQYGSVAAGQFLSDESLMSELQARAPRGWERMNLEVVLATDVVRGVGGRPRIVATYFW